MRLLLMRHAAAARSGPYSDADRPLTPEGEVQAERAARALVRLEPALRLLLTSPADRCRQTALPIAQAFQLAADRIRVTDSASVGSGAARLLQALTSLGDVDRVLLIGHEPDLVSLSSVLLSGTNEVTLHYRCSSIAGFDVDGMPPSCPAALTWFLDPVALRLLASDAR